jgi:hypothetical protein
MANYHIGLDFGTSQTKVCLLNKDSDVREFIKFENDNYFLPSLNVKKADNTFSYGNENENGIKYRYFKMAAAEDEHLIQVTNEDLEGNLQNGTIDDFRKYSTDYQIKPEILVVLYLTFTYLFIKQQKSKQNTQNLGGHLGRLAGKGATTQNTFSINLGIPTEWNNPNHIKRKIKFQSLLISSIELANQFENLDSFLNRKDTDLLNKISEINRKHLSDLDGKEENEKADLIKKCLKEYKLSVFPESAAGVNYLLKTGRLANGAYATLDIGAGTSDIAIFEVRNNTLSRYYCSESVEIASNDFYREYAKQHYNKDFVTFEEIKEIEGIIRNDETINENYYFQVLRMIRGDLNRKGIEFAVLKTLYRKYYLPLHQQNQVKAFDLKNNILYEKPIIIFGGGANLGGFCSGNYYFWQGANHNHDRHFEAKPITDFVSQVEIVDEDKVKPFINLLILALGLTYSDLDNNDSIPFVIPENDVQPLTPIHNDRYFYYDLQDAAYK